MVKGALFVGWGVVIPGREEVAQKVLNEAMQYLLKLQQEKVLDSFDVVMLEPHGGDLAGFVLAKGDKDAIARLRVSEEFARIVARAQFVHSHVGVVGAHTGAEMQALIRGWDEQMEGLV